MTTDQLKQVRAEVLSGIEDLQAHNEDRLLLAMKDINISGPVLAEAGFDVAGMDMDFSSHQRLIVHLDKVKEVRSSVLRSLIKSHQKRKTLHAILTSILRAEELAGKVEVENLTYRRLIVYVGPIPSVRICWRAEEVFEELDESTQQGSRETPPPLPGSISHATPATPAGSAAAREPASYFGQDSFFERRPAPPVDRVAPEHAPAPGSHPAAAPTSESVATPSSDWKQESLERFKKMPNVSKYRR